MGHGGARPGAGRPRTEGGAVSRSLYCTERELEACKNLVAFVRALEADRVGRSGWDVGGMELQPKTFWGLLTGGDIWSQQDKAGAVADMTARLEPDTFERMKEAFPFLSAED